MFDSIIIIRQSKKRFDDILAYVDPKIGLEKIEQKIQHFKDVYPKDIIIVAQTLKDFNEIWMNN